jgi:uncharacterized membrane protein
MDNDLNVQDDDQATAPKGDETAGTISSTLFSSTRASRIRRPTVSGRPGSGASAATSAGASTTPTGTPTGSSTATANPSGRLIGPRTYAHLTAGLCYLGTPIVPAIVLFTPSPHRFSRFHALQALALFIIGTILAFCLSLLRPTSVPLGILYTLLVLAAIVLALLWMAAAIAAFEGVAVALPLLDRPLPRTPDLEEHQSGRIPRQQAGMELIIAAGVSALLLILTFTIPTVGWFKGLSKSTLASLGLSGGLPLWMIVSALLSSIIFAGIGLIVLAVFLIGLRKGKFFPLPTSGAAIVGAALTAAGTGLLLADTLQRSLYSLLTQQFDTLVNSSDPAISSKNAQSILQGGLTSLHSITAGQPLSLLLGVLLLVLGVLVMLFLLSQLYYKR